MFVWIVIPVGVFIVSLLFGVGAGPFVSDCAFGEGSVAAGDASSSVLFVSGFAGVIVTVLGGAVSDGLLFVSISAGDEQPVRIIVSIMASVNLALFFTGEGS